MAVEDVEMASKDDAAGVERASGLDEACVQGRREEAEVPAAKVSRGTVLVQSVFQGWLIVAEGVVLRLRRRSRDGGGVVPREGTSPVRVGPRSPEPRGARRLQREDAG